MFTAERTGLLAVIAAILFIAAASMCSRMGGDPDSQQAAPDSVLTVQIDSARQAAPDTSAKSPKKVRKKKASTKKPSTPPYSRHHRQERVDSRQ